MTIVERVNRLGKRHPLNKHFVRYEHNGWGMATVYYRLAAFGQTFRFRLERDASFISPALNVEHIYSDLRRLPFTGNLQHCFYRGEIQGEPNSTAVFNLCNGLVSTFVLFTYVVIIDVLIRALNFIQPRSAVNVLYHSGGVPVPYRSPLRNFNSI